ncbi:MAG: helix-turn-helix domain-containing protein [Candidatus Scalinduaceae bacterium]
MEDQLAKRIGHRIKSKRIERNINQNKLAEKVGISPAAINQFEKGEKKPSSDVLTRIAKELSVSTDSLLTEKGDEIFVDEEVKIAFRAFKKLEKGDRDIIVKNIQFLKEQAKRKGK